MKILKASCSVFVVIFIISFMFSRFVLVVVNDSNSINKGIVVVLDAGHGGRDGGCVGKNGTVESSLNLEYVKLLDLKLTEFGYKTVLTRKTESGLYSIFSVNKKVDDMNRRMEIIKNTNPNLVVSIHMNSFSDANATGSIVYYKVDDDASFSCASLIQNSLNKKINKKEKKTKQGDYFLLNCSYYTSVLIECGFLSNLEEEKNLNNNEYKNKLIYQTIFIKNFKYFKKMTYFFIFIKTNYPK